MANEELKKQNVDHALETACICFLKYGVEFVTREMLSRESGISRASLSRYWSDKTDCIIQTAEWFRLHMLSVFEEDQVEAQWQGRSGLEQLRGFMEWCQTLYDHDPRIFALYTEFKVYLRRSASDMAPSDKQLVQAMGFRPLVRKIYEHGVQDGSIHLRFDMEDEVAFFGDAFFGYLSNLAFRPEIGKENAKKDIDRYMERMVSLLQQQ